jgi:predicted RNA-binding Zn-ribbon protein involved in translation (DUF1610 family)
MAKIEVTCSCGKVFKMKDNEVKNCPRCGKPNRGPNATK